MNYRNTTAALIMAAVACTSTPAPAPPPAQPGTLSDAQLEALYNARQDSILQRYSPADVAFMQGMIHHHAQAVEMSNLVPSRTDNPGIRTLAARIINAQRDEIATMQRWLADRNEPVPELHTDGDHVMVHGTAHMHMPGMLMPAQLDSLRAARGTAFDRLFLRYMIEHHQGAVTMVHTLFATDGAAQDNSVFRLASDVQVDQKTEVARMQQMLAALPPGP